MRTRRLSLILPLAMLAALAVSGFAQDATTTKKEPSAAQKAQQQKMTDCNKEASAKNLKGDERKKFMSECLSAGSTTAPAKMTQQEKMTDCNKQASAKNLKGDERKTFMSSCLSSK